jgi:glyoxylase-like metal-dependent hydrolase (beta-lactamase superfamily II)
VPRVTSLGCLLLSAAALAALVPALGAQSAPPAAAGRGPAAPPPLVRSGVTTRITPHVYVIPDQGVPMVPNVGIIVGSRGTLVVDTGLGPANARTVLAEVAKVSRNQAMYLVATHFHPEHAGGASAFPETTKFIVSDAEQKDLDELGPGMIANFSRISPVHADLLKGLVQRPGNVHFASDYRVDLGGVTVRLVAVGPTHTRGDTVALVEPDHVLFAGDVVLKQMFLSFSAQSSGTSWLKALDTIEAMKPVRVVPSHGALADATVIGEQRAVLLAIQARVRELKAQGRSADQAAQAITTQFQTQYPDWASPARLAAAARTFFTELP